ncbi:MAG: HNH endonuclease [Muricauda sp.]|nr:HNH endonuclease [Allomuricauda sp.]MBO6532970.1 HNH endonuclease [Allomuricauda sp.]MBO6587481.1 HNH endonuclease [Allomuricauda sp.]MBO6617106.1 HNH endonuclease [Allomuricauda sp.]MBO6643883.1 HNH endonuclease [Allomuricauda sp.]MBO6745441.1 HNH endonuclease [Allomuricauda sp.]
MNIVFGNIEELKISNYALVAQPENNYWFAVSSKKLNDNYIKRFGDNFNLIIYSSREKDTNYYVIPFKVINHLFKEEFYSKDKKTTYSGKRWVGTIKNHILKITNNHNVVDVKEYFTNPYFLETQNLEEDLNDYEIENKRQEINVRINQSKFRNGVLDNFFYSCCISGISEPSLLVASHIIPWSHKKESRLDPRNGLCLSPLYDKLFDKGYFTISNDLRIITISSHENISKSLTQILNDINGKQISSPKKKIKIEYIEYHRKNIFLEREIK